MKDDIIKTIMAWILTIVTGILVWVCNNFTVPQIAVTITLILCGIAGWSLYRTLKIWLFRLCKKCKKND